MVAGERAATAPLRQEDSAAGRAMLIGITALPQSRGIKQARLDAKHHQVARAELIHSTSPSSLTQTRPLHGPGSLSSTAAHERTCLWSPQELTSQKPTRQRAHTRVDLWLYELQPAHPEGCSSVLAPGSPCGGTEQAASPTTPLPSPNPVPSPCWGRKSFPLWICNMEQHLMLVAAFSKQPANFHCIQELALFGSIKYP